MKNGILIALTILLVIGFISYFAYSNNTDTKWNDKCRASGGKVVESGKICDYVDCDHSKYSCSFPYNS